MRRIMLAALLFVLVSCYIAWISWPWAYYGMALWFGSVTAAHHRRERARATDT